MNPSRNRLLRRRERKTPVFPVKRVAEKPEQEEEHFLVPGHFLVDEADVPALLDRLNCSKENLPGILKMDPAIKKLKAKRGDVIRIERNSPTAGKATYYRVVR